MADGSATLKIPLTTREKREIVEKMFDPPTNLLSWEVFRGACEHRDKGKANWTEIWADHKEFVNNPDYYPPDFVVDFCIAELAHFKKLSAANEKKERQAA